MPFKGHSVPPQSQDWGPPLEGALGTLFPAVLCQHPPTHAPHRHLPATLQASFHHINQEACESELSTTTPLQSCLVASLGRHISPGQTPPTRHDSPVSAPNNGLSSHQWTQPNSCCLGPAGMPSPSSALDTAHVLPPLRRLGR